MKKIVTLGVLFLAAACAPTPKGEPVPIKLLFAENAKKPYECAEFDARSNSCEALAVRRVRGDRVEYRAEFILPRLPGVPGQGHVTINAPFKIEGNRYCGNFGRSDVKIKGLPSSYATDLAIALKVQLAKEGDVCTSYYRDGAGYLSVTTRRDGSPVRDGTGPVVFLTQPKALRRMSLF